MKSRALVLLFAIISTYIVFNRDAQKGNIYISDVSGYYAYLPALFIYHDAGTMQFHEDLAKKGMADNDECYLLKQPATGKKTDKYPMGAALFELPLFLAAHAFCKLTTSYPTDGYSLPYQWAGIMSTILWAMAGLFVLRRFLKLYFNDAVTTTVILCIAFGTNLYYYTAFTQGMSHAFSFFLFCSILYQASQWYKSKRPKHLYLLALLMGLVFITRPVNIIVFIVPVLWEVYSMESLQQRMRFFGANLPKLLTGALIFSAIVFMQLAYWKHTSGHWLYYSYGDEGFDFSHPKIWKGLMSYRKGWFVYTPLAFISVLGFFALWKQNKKAVPALILYFIAAIYVVFSWKNWWYGGGFGCRPLIESLALLALPLGALTAYVLQRRKILLSASLYAIIVFCVALNMFQTYQFSLGIIHHDRMARAYYWHVFGKTKINPAEYERYLLDEKEYWGENMRISK